uniref:Uncharacterized protein n=1 Tax=Romanomermis culicivorax TaxID=13658 RepID=A0A915KSJ7_ROMCU
MNPIVINLEFRPASWLISKINTKRLSYTSILMVIQKVDIPHKNDYECEKEKKMKLPQVNSGLYSHASDYQVNEFPNEKIPNWTIPNGRSRT